MDWFTCLNFWRNKTIIGITRKREINKRIKRITIENGVAIIRGIIKINWVRGTSEKIGRRNKNFRINLAVNLRCKQIFRNN